jgi:LPS export ABC transporter protein LptC
MGGRGPPGVEGMKNAVLVLAFLLPLAACEKLPQAEAPSKEDSANLSFHGFKVRASHEGQMLWEAEAAYAKVYQQSHRAEAQQVTLTYFQNGRRVSQAWADRADMDLSDYDVKARGHVKVKGSNGVLLLTEQLDWDNTLQMATSPVKVRVERKGTVLTGWGMRADRALQDVRILREVEAEAQSVDELRQTGADFKK